MTDLERRSKIDSMREEIMRMRRSIDTLIRQGASTPQSAPTVGPAETNTSPQEKKSPPEPALPTREDNTHMAMTRENSVEPGANGDQAVNLAVTVEEPMGSLYEVTRLRNIRSNPVKSFRPASGPAGEPNDFISRGVISEAEAAELYRR
jgi:hypothetical protein